MKPDTYLPLREDDPNQFVMVSAGSQVRVTDNFTEGELYNPRIGKPHPISIQAVQCVQIIRDAFNYPIRITSTYRTYVPTGGVSKSPHMMGCAVDFQFIGQQDMLDRLYVSVREDYKKKGPLFQALWNAGCRGFGVYDTFLHVDTVQPELYPATFGHKRTEKYKGEQFAYWNNQKRLRYETATIDPRVAQQSSMSFSWLLKPFGSLAGMFREITSPDDRGKDISLKSVVYAIVAVLIIALSIFYIYKSRKTILGWAQTSFKSLT